MKLARGSSDHFTIGLVLFSDLAVAETCRLRIQKLRKELGMKLSGEAASFHFRKMDERHRTALLNTVAPFAFQFFSCTVDKTKLTGRVWQKKEYMYHRTGIMALDLARADMLEAKLVFAATGSRKFDQAFLRELKRHAGYCEKLPVIGETQRLEAYKDELVQLADMVCGALRSDDPQYLKLIRHREGGRRLYPP